MTLEYPKYEATFPAAKFPTGSGATAWRSNGYVSVRAKGLTALVQAKNNSTSTTTIPASTAAVGFFDATGDYAPALNLRALVEGQTDGNFVLDKPWTNKALPAGYNLPTTLPAGVIELKWTVDVAVPATGSANWTGMDCDAVLSWMVNYHAFSQETNTADLTRWQIRNGLDDSIDLQTVGELASEAQIQLGDYIDLPGITVAGVTVTDQAVTPTTLPFAGYDGRLRRLIVVGINSFNAYTDGVAANGGSMGNSSYIGGASAGKNGAVAHLVFQSRK